MSDAETLATESGQPAAGYSKAAPLRCGDSVERYVLLDRLGRGGEGTVFSAFDPALDRYVAIKTLLTSNEDAALAEARALAAVSHPNVVGVVDVGRTRGQVWFAMERLEGKTIRAAARSSEHGFDERLGWMLGAGAGLVALHAAGLVHRDIKPENIMLDGGRARIVDLGLARSRPDEVTTKPDLARVEGPISGTARYFAPELLDRQVADALSDQFSFCLTACEVLFGENPFAAKTVHAQWTRAIDGDMDAPRTRGGRQRRIWEVLERGLRPDRTARFESLAALLEALRTATAPSKSWVRTVGVAAGLLVAVTTSMVQLQRSAEAASLPVPAVTQEALPADPVPALEQAFRLAVQGQDLVEARRWLEHGVSLGVEEGTEAEVLVLRGNSMLALREGRVEEAVAHAQAVVSLGSELWGSTDPRAVQDRLALAGLGQHLGAHDDAIAIYRGLLADVEGTDRPDELRAMVTHNLAAAYLLTGRLDAARHTGFEAIETAVKADGGFGDDVVYAYAMLGEVFAARGEAENALSMHGRARLLVAAMDAPPPGATERDAAYAIALLGAGHWEHANHAAVAAVDDAVARDGFDDPGTVRAQLQLRAVGLLPG